MAAKQVSLNSTLIRGRYALPNQRVTFTCITRNATVLNWISTDYIGAGNFFPIPSVGIARNRTSGSAVATRLDTYVDSGSTVIISQLHITASEQFPTSSVTCRINGEGPSETIDFITTETAVATTGETMDISESNDDSSIDGTSYESTQETAKCSTGQVVCNPGVVVGVPVAIALAIIVSVVVIIVTVILIKERKYASERKNRKNSIEPEKGIKPCPPKEDKLKETRESNDESEKNEAEATSPAKTETASDSTDEKNEAEATSPAKTETASDSTDEISVPSSPPSPTSTSPSSSLSSACDDRPLLKGEQSHKHQT